MINTYTPVELREQIDAANQVFGRVKEIKEYAAYRIFPGGRIEAVTKIPLVTAVLLDANLAAQRLEEGHMVYVDIEAWNKRCGFPDGL